MINAADNPQATNDTITQTPPTNDGYQENKDRVGGEEGGGGVIISERLSYPD